MNKKSESFLLRIIEKALKNVYSNERYYSVFGDLHEEFYNIAARKSRPAAYLWAFYQLILIILGNLYNRFYWSLPMLRNYMTISLRKLKQNKIYTSLNIAGLVVGLTTFIFIFLYVNFELSYDNFHTNNIFRLKTDWRGLYISYDTPAPLAPTIQEEFPEVVSATRLQRRYNILINHDENSFYEKNFYKTDREFFNVFDYKLIKGDKESFLNEPNSIIMSERMVEKYFDQRDPIGRQIRISNTIDYTVKGVMRNSPANSHLKIDFLVAQEEFQGPWTNTYLATYCVLDENTDVAASESKFVDLIDKKVYQTEERRAIHLGNFMYQPIVEINRFPANMKNIYIFSSLAILILLAACINYMNLVTARSGNRMKEIGLRKVIGARKNELVKQFLGESIFMSLLATGISVILIKLLLPTFNNFIDKTIGLSLINDLPLFIGILCLALTVGLIAGLYPSLYLSSFRPVLILKGGIKGSVKTKKFRNILITLQFMITTVLLFSTLIIKDQLSFIQTKDLGFSKEQIITLDIKDKDLLSQLPIVKSELLNNPDITIVSLSDGLPNATGSATKLKFTKKGRANEVIVAGFSYVDEDYLRLFDLRLNEGRGFSAELDKSGAIVMNEKATQILERENITGETYSHYEKEGLVTGILKDFHYKSLHREIGPLYLVYDPERADIVSMKINSDNIPRTLDYIKKTMFTFSPDYPFEYKFFDESFDSAYRSEQKMMGVFSMFSIIAIVIGCLGLVGLSSFLAEQKTKEIGIRKTLGSSIAGLLILLVKDFVRLVLIAILISLPLGYFFMNRWLENFAYKTSIGLDVFIITALSVILMAVITISFQTIKATLANPIDSLRCE